MKKLRNTSTPYLIIVISAIMMCLSFLSCNAKSVQDTNTEYVEDMEENNPNLNYLHFHWDNVEDVIYYKDDNGFIIEYNDPDVFDYTHLKEITHRDKWFGEADSICYIPIQIDNRLVSKFLEDYNDSINDYEWIIVEKYIPEVQDILWYLELKSNTGLW